MNIWKSVRSLFGRKATPPERIEPSIGDNCILNEETGLIIDADDPLAAELIAKALKSGKPAIGRRDENGKITIEELKP